MYTLDQVRQMIEEWYPDLEVDAEIVRDGKVAELVVTSATAGTQALVRTKADVYRWFGFLDVARPFAAAPRPPATPVHSQDAGQGWLF